MCDDDAKVEDMKKVEEEKILEKKNQALVTDLFCNSGLRRC